MQRLAGQMRSAIEQYHMIEPGSRIAVGVSGGKDSVALLCGLAELRRYLPAPFELTAVTLDPCFNGEPTDFSPITALCDSLSVPHVIRPTRLGELIFDVRQEKNPCSLCAKMRRGILHNLALELGCDRLALGHHFDDAVETFFMNLLYGGKIGCFSPVTFLDRKQITVIRPMIFVEEKNIRGVVRRYELPVVESRCPVDKNTSREEIKQLVRSLEKDYDRLRTKVVGAMQRSGLDGW